MNNRLVVVRGAGDLATGILYILKNFGYSIVVTELAAPSAIRRTISLCEAVYEGVYSVENITGERCEAKDVPGVLAKGHIPVLVDPEAKIIQTLRPDVVVDAIIAKKNLGTTMDMAGTVIGVGPGFTAGGDVHAVVETNRGHTLGRVITEGPAQKDSGMPGVVGGYARERVIYAPASGRIKNIASIGSHVESGQTIATVNGESVRANISGILRGLIRDGYPVTDGFKTADVDPRDVPAYCYTVSDKARLIGFGTLLAIQMLSK
jgi:xanthine dehydrogenase accessory factor